MVHFTTPLTASLPATTATMNGKHADDAPTTCPATAAAIVHTKPAPALLRDILAAQLKRSPAMSDDTTVLVADLGHIYRQYRQWREHLPAIEPFYAVKCNPAPVILETLVRAGAGFDVASKWELDQVLDQGADPAKIIYANPTKPASHLRHAAAMGVRLMTFDSVDELRKIRTHHPNPLLVMRMAFGAGHARMALDTVGVDPDREARAILMEAKQLGLDVVGVAFHVGSGCFDARAYPEAVVKARSVFSLAAELGFNMTLLDVGGGFPGGLANDPSDGRNGSTFSDMATALRDSIAREFATMPVRVIAEPGRYFVAHAYHVAVNVIGQRMRAAPTPNAQQCQYVRLHEGAFSLFERGNHPRGPYVIVKDGEMIADPHQYVGNGQLFSTTCYGPTCAAEDLVVVSRMLPAVQSGDWLLFDVMGAYSVAVTTKFNGFSPPPAVWTNTEAASIAGLGLVV